MATLYALMYQAIDHLQRMEFSFETRSVFPLHYVRLVLHSVLYLKFTGAKQKITEIKEICLQWLKLWQRCTNCDVTPLRLSALHFASPTVQPPQHFLNGDGFSCDKWLCIPSG
jgi:hypothetical protein